MTICISTTHRFLLNWFCNISAEQLRITSLDSARTDDAKRASPYKPLHLHICLHTGVHTAAAILDFCSDRRQNSDWSPTENPWNDFHPNWTSANQQITPRENPKAPLGRAEPEPGQLWEPWVYRYGGQGDSDEAFSFFSPPAGLWACLKKAEDSEGFIERKMSGPTVSRSSLRKSVGVKSEGKWLTLSVGEGAETNWWEQKHW